MAGKVLKRFSIAPIYAAVALGILQVVAMNLTPLVQHVKGRGAIPHDARRAYQVANYLNAKGYTPLRLGGGAAIIGVVSVFLLPLLRYLWMLAAGAATLSLGWFLLLILQGVYMS